MARSKKCKVISKRKGITMKQAILASIALHVLVLILVSLNGCGAPKGEVAGEDGEEQSATSNDKKGKMVDKPEELSKDVEIELVPKDSVAVVEPPKPKKVQPEKALDGFGGIGVEFASKDGTIAKVPRGYPAYNAGLQPGDIIISPTLSKIRGEPGTKVNILVQRGSEIFNLTLIREFISTTGIQKQLEEP